MAELDPDVIEVAKAQFGRVHRGAFDDPRLKVTVGDGLAYLRATGVRYDLVAMDLTDPVGPSVELYSPATFALARRAMADGGALVLHLGSPFSHPERVRQTLANLREVFRVVAPYFVHIPLYGSIWGFACASDTLDPRALEPARGRPAHRRARRGRPAVLQRRDAPRRVRAAELRAPPRRLGAAEPGRERCSRSCASPRARVTLVLIGLAGLAGCGDERRDVYATREDCLADWGNKPEDCTPATDSRHAGRGFFYGPAHSVSYRSSGVGLELEPQLRLGLLLALVVVEPLLAARRARLARRLRLVGPLLGELRAPMKREELVPRPDWPRKVEELGFHFHTIDGVYWDERACYRFTAAEVDKLELATGGAAVALHRRGRRA